MTVYAHSLDHRPLSEWQELDDHLSAVAALAERFAAAFDAAPWGRLAGLWHDLGKYQPKFQDYIRGKGDGVEHAVIGALLAQAKDPKGLDACLPLAFVIAGHHTGLANLAAGDGGGPKPLVPKLREARHLLTNALPSIPKPLQSHALPALPARLQPTRRLSRTEQERLRRASELWIRFLFSSLVDADFLDTDAFYRPGERLRETAGFASIGGLRERLDAFVDDLAAKAKRAKPSPVNELRTEVLEACRRQAERPPGMFSLSVPTGGGKTLAAMAFALRHAERHGLRRVIAAIPYTSIIEQNAAVYRRALGDRNVIEHHSNLDPDKETRRNKLTSENWDAPVIVTTNVQLFESLFARRGSRCRKVHNVAKSVILLDEAQTLPAGFLLPILDALRELCECYGCSVVLSTATQPALERRPGLEQGLENVREIAPEPRELARRLRRFDASWPEREADPLSWDDLAAQLVAHPQVMAIVHRRQDARDLARLLPEDGRFHLSALMCAAHRSVRLREIGKTLKTGTACRVVSTQLVEAGVDLDFPVVYRALAGLDSLTQAGGRCNREGRQELGRLVVFRAPTPPPPGTPRRALETMESLLRREETVELGDPELVETYFRLLYQKEQLDAKGIQAERQQLNFATVARRFQLIEDTYQRPIVVPWGEARERLDRFRRDPSRDTLRALQPYVVNVPVRQLEQLRADAAVEEIHDTVVTLAAGYHHLYDKQFGLMIGEEVFGNPGALVA